MRIIKMLNLCELHKNDGKMKSTIQIITDYTKGGQKPLFSCQKTPKTPEK